MASIERFEDIEAWKKARALTKLIHDASNVGRFAKDFALKDQIRRASVSTMSNIAEGFERGGDQEFIQHLAMAKGSCGEVRSQLYVALDQGYFNQETFERLYSDAETINRMIAGFMTYLQKSPLRGSKYKNRD
jgi:four helix bundle protein